MWVIGLTGNFGTGKSTVAKMLVDFGAVLINADEVGHQLLRSNSQIHNELLNVFGPDILDANSEIDRRKLGKIAFQSAEGTLWLNQIMGPMIREVIQGKIEEYRQLGTKIIVLESALMFRSRWKTIVQEVWMTIAPLDVIISRWTGQRGYNEEEIINRLNRQMTPWEMLNQADLVIDTNCSLLELHNKVSDLWMELIQRIQEASKIKTKLE